MEVVDTTQINSLPSSEMQANAPQSEPIFVLSSSQLREIISQAIQPLKDEIIQLHAARDQDRAEFDRFKTAHKQFAIQTGRDLDALFEANLTTTAKPETNKKTTDHIDELHRLMNEEKSHQVSIAKAARLLGISKERMRQLKPLILQDGRFEMGWGQIKGKKAVVIRIRKFL